MVTLPTTENNHDFAVDVMKQAEAELKPYDPVPSLIVSNLWTLILDLCSGIEEFGSEPDKDIQKLYEEHDIMPLREGYLEKWWELNLRSVVLRGKGRWWLSLDPKNIQLTADATDLLNRRYRTAWRLYTAEALHQKDRKFSFDAWQKLLGNLQEETSADDLAQMEAELF